MFRPDQALNVNNLDSNQRNRGAFADKPLPPATLLDRCEFAGFRFVRGFLTRLPRHKAIQVGASIGSAFYHLDPRRSSVARYNLALAFPDRSEAEREGILLRSCRNLGRIAAEFCHLEKLTPDSVRQYVTPEDPDLWEQGFAAVRGRPVVVLTGHLGNWELLAYAHGLMGAPVTLVHRAMRNPLVDAAILSVRRRAGTRSIAKKTAAREMLRALRRNEWVAIAADQNQTRRYGVFVQFFGMVASTTPGPARLAMLTGAPVYPVFLIREGETERHRIVALPAIEMTSTSDREADVITNTQRCTSVIEHMVRRHPDQWIWFHKRWRTRPQGEPKLYR